MTRTVVLLATFLIFTVIKTSEFAPTNDQDVENIGVNSPEESVMVPRVLRLSLVGANLTNYAVQWVPLGQVLFSNTVYYPIFG